MLQFVQRLFAAPPTPIGIDCGSETLRLAQCLHDGRDWRLIAAACAPVPTAAKSSAAEYGAFLRGILPDLLRQGFRGKRVAMAVPIGDANDSRTDHRRPAFGAATRNRIGNRVRTIERAGLSVAGLSTASQAIVDCFAHVYRRTNDATDTSAFIDLGASAARVTVARANRIAFAGTVPIGGDAFNAAAAAALRVPHDLAALLRIKLARRVLRPTFDLLPRPPPDVTTVADRRSRSERVEIRTAEVGLTPREIAERDLVEAAIAPHAAALAAAIDSIRTQYQSQSPLPIDRLIFVGGEARQADVCRTIATHLGLPAQLGDPLVRMRAMPLGAESGIDFDVPQPAWACAIGTAIGPKERVAAVAA